MKRKLKRLLLAAIWAIALAFSARADEAGSAFPVSCQPGVQAMFDRATAALDEGRSEQAREAFAEIVRLDATCAMAYWGVASVEMGNLRSEPSAQSFAEGAAAIAHAKMHGGKTERECELIDAVAQYYHLPEERSQDMRMVHHERALARSRQLHPDDPEIVKRHTAAWMAVWARAVERVDTAYARREVP